MADVQAGSITEFVLANKSLEAVAKILNERLADARVTEDLERTTAVVLIQREHKALQIDVVVNAGLIDLQERVQLPVEAFEPAVPGALLEPRQPHSARVE